VKQALAAFLFLSLLTCAGAQDNCIARGKQLFSEGEYIQAEAALKACVAAQKTPDGNAYISLAGVQMVLGKFAEAETNFKTALRALPPKSPYIAYVNSLLGDIAMRKPDLKEAAFFYSAALRAEPGNINALVGRGITEEKAGRTEEAAEYYRRALAVDFTNIVARERLIAMEPDILKYDELLAMLKERNITDPSSPGFSPEDEALLRKMIQAEKDSGIEYLASKYHGRIPDGFIVERDRGKIYVRKMLTRTGYQELINQLSRDAKQFFLAKDILPGNIFKLKDFDGNEVFNDEGNLTDAGLAVYTKGLYGQKAYVQPGELLPRTQKEIDDLVKLYLRQGYSEISTPEFLHLMRHTQCSEQTLVKDAQVRVININNRQKRIFVVSDPKREDAPAILPWQYVLEFRREYNSSGSGTPVTSSSAFGLGGGVPLKLCKKDGTLSSGSLEEIARSIKSARQAK